MLGVLCKLSAINCTQCNYRSLPFLFSSVRFPGWFYSRRVTNPLRALCTIFVLCYTTITSISIKLLHFVPIGDKYYLYQDGTLEFFKTPKYIVYGSVAILFIVVVVIPVPAYLMFTPFSNVSLVGWGTWCHSTTLCRAVLKTNTAVSLRFTSCVAWYCCWLRCFYLSAWIPRAWYFLGFFCISDPTKGHTLEQ